MKEKKYERSLGGCRKGGNVQKIDVTKKFSVQRPYMIDITGNVCACMPVQVGALFHRDIKERQNRDERS